MSKLVGSLFGILVISISVPCTSHAQMGPDALGAQLQDYGDNFYCIGGGRLRAEIEKGHLVGARQQEAMRIFNKLDTHYFTEKLYLGTNPMTASKKELVSAQREVDIMQRLYDSLYSRGFLPMRLKGKDYTCTSR
jgi:hypothetical protein